MSAVQALTSYRERTTPTSLRHLEFFLTTTELCDILNEPRLMEWQRDFMEARDGGWLGIFARGNRIRLDNGVETNAKQLTFFHWAVPRGILDAVAKHKDGLSYYMKLWKSMV